MAHFPFVCQANYQIPGGMLWRPENAPALSVFFLFYHQSQPAGNGDAIKSPGTSKITLQPLAVIPVKAGIHENQLYGFPDRVVE